MLILTRKLGEKIIIGDNICVTVLSASGGQVRLGTEAPAHVTVHREEIYQKIQENHSNQINKLIDRREDKNETV